MADSIDEQPSYAVEAPRRRRAAAQTDTQPDLAAVTGEMPLVIKPRAPRKPKTTTSESAAIPVTPRVRPIRDDAATTETTAISFSPTSRSRSVPPTTQQQSATSNQTNAASSSGGGAISAALRARLQAERPADTVPSSSTTVTRVAMPRTTTGVQRAVSRPVSVEVQTESQSTATPTTTLHPAISAVSRPESAAASIHYDITMIPGTTRHDTVPIHRRAPILHPKSRIRIHRFVLIGLFVLLCIVGVSVVPISRALGAPLLSWKAEANAFALPTMTPTPGPVYADHPVIGGEHSFVCVALPFARLAQQRMEEQGMEHPWYVSVILAQWGVEQGWSLPSYTGYNWGNVSAIPGYPAVGGIPVAGSPLAFAYAYNPMQGMDYYVIYVQKGYYTGVTAAYPRGPQAQAIAIGQSPWDADHYAINGYVGAKLLNAMNAFDLYRFDNPSAQC